MKAARGKWRRRLAWTFGAAALLVVAILLALLGSLRFESVQQGIVARISQRLERSMGAGVRAQAFTLEPGRGVLSIRGLEVFAVGHADEPFLVASEVRAEVDLRALLRGAVLLRDLRVETPRLALDASLPSSPQPEGKADTAFEIRAFDLDAGTIEYPGSFRISGIAARGSFSGGRAEAMVSKGALHVEPRSRPLDLDLEGSLVLALDETFEVKALKARGKGLSLEARAAGSLHPLRLEASYEIEGDLAQLIPDVIPGGSVSLSGNLEVGRDVPGPRGTVHVVARGIPGEAVAPFIPVELPPALVLRGTELQATGDLDVDLSSVRSVAELRADAILGTASLAWRRGAARLLEASAVVERDASSAADGSARCSVRAALFPDSPGERRLEASAKLRSWLEAENAELLEAKLRVIEPGLAAALERLGIHVPWPEGKVPGGALEATLEASGPLAAPRLALDGTLHDEGEVLATLSGRSLPGWKGWRSGMLLDLEASLLPGIPGSRRAQARLVGLDLRDGLLRLDLPDLGRAVEDLGRRAGKTPELGERRLDEMLAGPLQAEARLSGPVTSPHLSLDATWHPNGQGSLRLRASGQTTYEAPFVVLSENATIDAQDIDATPFGVPDLFVRALVASSDGKSVSVESFAATLPPLAADQAPGELQGHGRFDLAWPPRTAEADLVVEHPLQGVERAVAKARLEDGVLHVDRLDVDSGGSTARIHGAVPLAALAAHAGRFGETLESYARGPISLEAEGIELSDLCALLPLPERFPVPSGTLHVTALLDAEHPPASSGVLELDDAAFDLEGRHVAAEGPIRIELREGKAVLVPTKLLASTPGVPDVQALQVSGAIELAQDWTPGAPLSALIRDTSLDLHGRLDMPTFARLLGRGTASGSLALDASASGGLDDLSAEIRVSGPDVRISFFSPYATRFEAPEVQLRVRHGKLEIESARARWNAGELEVHGSASQEAAHLRAEFSGVSYRLDYGANARIGGRLDLDWELSGDRTLSGELSIDRATLRKNVALDRELLRSLFEPQLASESTLLDTIQLDLDVTTSQGLQIKNNLADLHADWDPLHVGGTLASPRLTGEARVTPGGLLNVLGNIVRVDEGTLSWSGDPPSSPRIAMKTTSSTEDPTIKNQWYHSWYQAPVLGPGQGGTLDLTSQHASSAEVMDAFATGVMNYYHDWVASAVSGTATQTELSYQPLALFGESDTTARMTLTQHLSRYATFIASSNPVDAEAQTFILDVHGLGPVPGLSAQLFQNDAKNTGGTLQQTVRLGTGVEEDENADRLRRVKIEVPEGISKRRIRKAVSYRPGEPIPAQSELDVEGEVLEALHRAGYPLAEVSVRLERNAPRTFDLTISVTPGERVRFEFEGDRPRSSARHTIAALYRVGEEEQDSLEEIRQETLRALQARGYLQPEVEVRVEAGEAGRATVFVRAEGGRKADPKAPTFLGVEPGAAATLSALFPSRSARIALAAGAASADQRVTRALAAFGYPAARVVSRELSEDGHDLAVRVEPGERQSFSSVKLVGLPAEDEARLAPQLVARPGEPVVADSVARSILVLERDLRSRGHAQVDVRARLEPASAERPLERALTLEVTPGPRFEIEDVRFRGQRASRPGWLHDVAALEPGRPVDPQEISMARARLSRSGVFQEIKVATDPPTETSARGKTAETDGPIPTEVQFDLAERKRWQLSYGGRYESNVGFGFVTDLYNFNSLGRGHTTGVRAIYSGEENRLQLYHQIPRFFGERSSLEGLVEWKRELDEGVWWEGEHAWLQATLPLSRRWQNRVYTEFEHRTLTAENPDPNAPLDQRSFSPRLGWQLVYDSRVLPSGGVGRSRGFFYGLNLVGSTSALGSDVTGLGTFQQWSHFLPIGDPERGRLDWAHSYRVSTINAKDDTVPTDNLLHAGGEFSVRGYPTNSLGPQDSAGQALGGELLFIANEELHVRLGGGVSGLVFFDAGNVWATFQDLTGHLASSCGLGFRWFSPLGPLRLDWAVPLDRRTDDPHSTLYIGFGNVF